MTFVSCANLSENEPNEQNGPKIDVGLCHFFFLPRVLITCLSDVLMARVGFGALWPGCFMP